MFFYFDGDFCYVGRGFYICVFCGVFLLGLFIGVVRVGVDCVVGIRG